MVSLPILSVDDCFDEDSESVNPSSTALCLPAYYIALRFSRVKRTVREYQSRLETQGFRTAMIGIIS